MTVATSTQGPVRKPIGTVVAQEVRADMIGRKNAAMSTAAVSAGPDELWAHELVYDLSLRMKSGLMRKFRETHMGTEMRNARFELTRMRPRSKEYSDLLNDMASHPASAVAELKKFIEMELNSELWANTKNYDDLKPHLNVALELIDKIHGVDSHEVAKELVEALKELKKEELMYHHVVARNLMERKGQEVREWADKMALYAMRTD